MSTEFSTEKKGLIFGEFHISKIRIYLHISKKADYFLVWFTATIYGDN